jgi:hypothetical protein
MSAKSACLFVLFVVVVAFMLSMFSSQLFPTVNAMPSAPFASNDHGLLDGSNDMRPASLPFFQGTGECGYYRNTGIEHRNGLVDPHYCTSDISAAVIVSVVEKKHHTSNTTPAVVPPATDKPVDDKPVVVPPTTDDKPETPVVVPDDNPTDNGTDGGSTDDGTKKHCNKGEGNGGEGCDPGNHPEKGNDDENKTTPKEDKPNK